MYVFTECNLMNFDIHIYIYEPVFIINITNIPITPETFFVPFYNPPLPLLIPRQLLICFLSLRLVCIF